MNNATKIYEEVKQHSEYNAAKPLTAGDQLVVFGHLMNYLITSADTGGRYSIYEDNVPPAGGPPPHTHPDEELFYVLEGEFEFLLNDLSKPFVVKPGELVRIPPMAVHTFRNISSKKGRFITILLPGNLEHYFSEAGIRVTDPAQVPDLSVPPDFANMDLSKAFQLADKHKVTFLLPK